MYAIVSLGLREREMRRNDRVALIVLSIAMVVVGLYLLSVVSAWFWAITLWQWAIAVFSAIPGKIYSIIVWILSAAFWVLAVIGLALTIGGAFLLWKLAAPPDRPGRRTILILVGLLVLGVVFLFGSSPKPGHVQDEAMRAGVPASAFEAAGDNYFDGMDPGVKLSEAEIKGRNVWLVWTGGNDRFWDTIIKDSFGTFDLLKTISSTPGLTSAATIAGNISAWSTSPASKGRPSPIRIVMACGSTSDAPTVRLIHSPMRKNIPASNWARGAVPASRSARTTASPRVSSDCGCFPIRILTRRRAAVGIRNGITTTRAIISRRTWCGPTVSAWHAGFVMSGRARRIRRTIPKIQSGQT